MPVVKCGTCKGKGFIKKERYVLDAIGRMFQNPEGHIGASVERTRIMEEHTYKEEYSERCPSCGGSGCKWKERKKYASGISQRKTKHTTRKS